MIEHVYNTFEHLRDWRSLAVYVDKFAEFAEAIHAKGAPLRNLFGFIDGKLQAVARPGLEMNHFGDYFVNRNGTPKYCPSSLPGNRALCLKRVYNSNNCLNPSPSPAGARVTSPGPLGRSPAVSLTSGTCGLSVCAPSAMWSIPPCQQFIRDAERSIRCARG